MHVRKHSPMHYQDKVQIKESLPKSIAAQGKLTHGMKVSKDEGKPAKSKD